MNKDKRNSVIALSALVLAFVSIGVVYTLNKKISADTVTTSSSSSAIPLKIGWNYLTNGSYTLDVSSKVIGLNGSLFSFKELINRKVVEKLVRTGDNKVIEGDSKIDPHQQFAVLVNDISAEPAAYLEENATF